MLGEQSGGEEEGSDHMEEAADDEYDEKPRQGSDGDSAEPVDEAAPHQGITQSSRKRHRTGGATAAAAEAAAGGGGSGARSDTSGENGSHINHGTSDALASEVRVESPPAASFENLQPHVRWMLGCTPLLRISLLGTSLLAVGAKS